MAKFPSLVAHLFVAVCALSEQAQAAGLRRLRKNTIIVPNLDAVKTDDHSTNHVKDDGERGFEKLNTEELEEIFSHEDVFRLDASMSYEPGSSSKKSSKAKAKGRARELVNPLEMDGMFFPEEVFRMDASMSYEPMASSGKSRSKAKSRRARDLINIPALEDMFFSEGVFRLDASMSYGYEGSSKKSRSKAKSRARELANFPGLEDMFFPEEVFRMDASMSYGLELAPSRKSRSKAKARQLRNPTTNRVRVADLSPRNSKKARKKASADTAEAGFERLEEALEETFLKEVFRMDASMSYSTSSGTGPKDREDGGGGGGTSSSAAGSGSSSSAAGGGSSNSAVDREDSITSDSVGGGTNVVAVVEDYAVVVEEEIPREVQEDGGDDGSQVFQKCGMPAASRSSALLEILSSVSDRSKLEDMSTPHYSAMRWLDQEDGAVLCPDIAERVMQRYKAGLIYFQFGGNSWTNCRAQEGFCFQEKSTTVPAIRFLDSSHECLWFGLGCVGVPQDVLPTERDLLSIDEVKLIDTVDLNDNNLSGELFDELFSFTQLRELTLDGNKKITGTIPEAVGQLSLLQSIDIDDNDLVGTLPQALYSLLDLQAIDLNSNRLSGTISNDIGNLKKLVVVQLDNNNFGGVMPADGLLQLEQLGKGAVALFYWSIFVRLES